MGKHADLYISKTPFVIVYKKQVAIASASLAWQYTRRHYRNRHDYSVDTAFAVVFTVTHYRREWRYSSAPPLLPFYFKGECNHVSFMRLFKISFEVLCLLVNWLLEDHPQERVLVASSLVTRKGKLVNILPNNGSMWCTIPLWKG